MNSPEKYIIRLLYDADIKYVHHVLLVIIKREKWVN